MKKNWALEPTNAKKAEPEIPLKPNDIPVNMFVDSDDEIEEGNQNEDCDTDSGNVDDLNDEGDMDFRDFLSDDEGDDLYCFVKVTRL